MSGSEEARRCSTAGFADGKRGLPPRDEVSRSWKGRERAVPEPAEGMQLCGTRSQLGDCSWTRGLQDSKGMAVVPMSPPQPQEANTTVQAREAGEALGLGPKDNRAGLTAVFTRPFWIIGGGSWKVTRESGRQLDSC